jgi:hypothetical protein
MPSLVFGAEIIQATTSATDSSELTTPLPRKDSLAGKKNKIIRIKVQISSWKICFMWGTREVSFTLLKLKLQTI